MFLIYFLFFNAVEWGIWPAAQWVNFYLLPMRYRILFDNVISFFFDIYSPYIKYKTELKEQSADGAKQSSEETAGAKVIEKLNREDVDRLKLEPGLKSSARWKEEIAHS